MKTVALTYGDGHYAPIRDIITDRFRELNEIETRLILPEHVPFPLWRGAWIKPFLWELVEDDVDRILWFDADMVPLRPVMDLLPKDPVPFAAVSDCPQAALTAIREEPTLTGARHYFNTGFFIASRDSIPMFKEAQKLMPAHGKTVRTYFFWEQTPINMAIEKHLRDEAVSLPAQLNWLWVSQGRPGKEVRMVHYAGWRGVEERVRYMLAHLRQVTDREGRPDPTPEDWKETVEDDNSW